MDKHGVLQAGKKFFDEVHPPYRVTVHHLSQPVVFSLPAVAPPPGQQGTCVWWDSAAGAYSPVGCVSVPNPQPAGHVLAFLPSYPTPTDASLAGAWTISGPLTQGCESTVLDCSMPPPQQPPGVYLDLSEPLFAPRVGCGSPSQALRVFSGRGCALWRANNSAGCFWSAQVQAFVGPGCVASAAPTQCMCRHLTARCAACMPPHLRASLTRC